MRKILGNHVFHDPCWHTVEGCCDASGHTGDRVTVSSKRGFIRAVAVVTRRLKPLNVNGQQVETVGIPIHWGFEGVARKGYIANTLTPNVGDANSQTPEYKAFLVNIEKA